VSGQEFVHHEVAASPSMAFAGGLPDCEVVAVAWPDRAQLTAGTWLEFDELAVADGVAPTRMADAARNRAQSESPTEKVSQRFRPNKELTSLSLSREVVGVA